jgi:DNA polymerase III subunit chi
MTEIAFHFNVSDKLVYGCRLLRKAYLSGANVVVTAESELLVELDTLLWSFSPTEFVPHCLTSASETSLAGTPVLVVQSLLDSPECGILVNLGQEMPDGFERFERVIEVVTQADDDRLTARGRWKYYADRGYAMKRYDLTSVGERA